MPSRKRSAWLTIIWSVVRRMRPAASSPRQAGHAPRQAQGEDKLGSGPDEIGTRSSDHRRTSACVASCAIAAHLGIAAGSELRRGTRDGRVLFSWEFARQAIIAPAFAGVGAQYLFDFPGKRTGIHFRPRFRPGSLLPK